MKEKRVSQEALGSIPLRLVIKEKIGITNNEVENLVDIHNQLMLLHYQNNDSESFQKSFKFARTLAARINYNKGLVESYMNKAWIETDNRNFIEAITHASQALAIDEILESATAFTTALYIISEANYSVGDIVKGIQLLSGKDVRISWYVIAKLDIPSGFDVSKKVQVNIV